VLELVESSYAKLREISDDEATQPIEPGQWSRKQVMGHLIDSACNNHQRFVRGQWCERLEFPAYQQEEWVECQRYDLREWGELVELWRAYNRHLVHVIGVMGEEHLRTPCVVGWGTESDNVMLLSEVIEHYWEHMEHHLGQVLQGR
jgi:uncharacterized damage-inducible protein DinB